MNVEESVNFSSEWRIGKVASVDTARMIIDVESAKALEELSVGQLVVTVGKTGHQYLVGVVEKVTRQIVDELDADKEIDGEILVTQENKDTLRAVLVGTFYSKYGKINNYFKRGADSFPQIGRDCFSVKGDNLLKLMCSTSVDIEEGQRLEIGGFVQDSGELEGGFVPAILNGDKFFQRHASILGSTGSGKSWSVALILEKASNLDFSNLVVFDMHGEYKPLTEGENKFASGFRFAGPGDLENPSDEVLFLPYWLLNREEILSMVVDRSEQNAPNQISRFTHHVKNLKEENLKILGKEEVLNTFTVDSPVPYSIDELIKRLAADDTGMVDSPTTGKPIKGDWNGKLTRFVARLRTKIDDRRYGFLFNPPESTLDYNWLSEQIVKVMSSQKDKPGIKVIDFSEVPSDILPIVTGVFARLIYEVQFWLSEDERTPFTIVCDEAHLYLPVKEETDVVEKRSLEAFERIAKEGRKYGVSLLVVSQRPADVSRTILSQCNNFMVLRLTNERDQGVVKRLMPDSMAGMTEMLPLLDIGECLVLGDAMPLPARVKVGQPSVVPTSATKQFWTEWGTRGKTQEVLFEAVETLRKQTRSRQ